MLCCFLPYINTNIHMSLPSITRIRIFLGTWKLYAIHISASLKFYCNLSTSLIFVGVHLFLCCIKSWIAATETKWSAKTEIFTIYLALCRKCSLVPGLGGNLDSERINIILSFFFHSPSGSHIINLLLADSRLWRYWSSFSSGLHAGHIRWTGLEGYVRVSAKFPLWGMIDQIELLYLACGHPHTMVWSECLCLSKIHMLKP